MASHVTDYGCGAFLAILLGHIPAPGEFFVALCAAEPGPGTDGTALADVEPSPAAGYARVSIATGTDAWSDPIGDAYATSLLPVSFGVPTDDWGEIGYYALCTEATGGEVLCYGEFDVPAVITATYEAVFPAGALTLQVASQDATIVS